MGISRSSVYVTRLTLTKWLSKLTLKAVDDAREEDRAEKDMRQPGKDNPCRSACIGVVRRLIGPCVVCVYQINGVWGTRWVSALQICGTNFIVRVPEEAFFVREDSRVGTFVEWSHLGRESEMTSLEPGMKSNATPITNPSRPGATCCSRRISTLCGYFIGKESYSDHECRGPSQRFPGLKWLFPVMASNSLQAQKDHFQAQFDSETKVVRRSNYFSDSL